MPGKRGKDIITLSRIETRGFKEKMPGKNLHEEKMKKNKRKEKNKEKLKNITLKELPKTLQNPRKNL